MKARIAVIASLVLLALTAGVAYVGVARNRVAGEIDERNAEAETFLEDWQQGDGAGGTDPGGGGSDAAEAEPGADLPFRRDDLVFVNRVPGPEYGRLAVLRDGRRHVLDVECDRAHPAAERLVCLRPTAGIVGQGRAEATVYSVGPDGFESRAFSDLGLASRARMASDGRYGASTVFVSGHSYLEAGQFATATSITEERDGEIRFHGLEEDFTAGASSLDTDDNYQVVDANWWGVTFGAGDEFFVTFGAGDRLEVLRGDVSDRHLTSFLDGVACPSASPDGRTLVVKRLGGSHLVDMVAVDVDSGEMTTLKGEDRPIEDQVEWLDDDTILYGVPRPDADDGAEPVHDVWSLDLRPGAEAELFLPYASSPGVVRADAS